MENTLFDFIVGWMLIGGYTAAVVFIYNRTKNNPYQGI